MKKTFTLFTLATLLTNVFTLISNSAKAQDMEQVGFANVYIKVISTPSGAGTACMTVDDSGLKQYRESYEFKQTLPVYLMSMEVNGKTGAVLFTTYYLYAKAADGHIFNGWYNDTNKDGQLDKALDEHISDNSTYIVTAIIEDDTEIYTTKAEATAAGFAAEPDIIFASFTSGAMVTTSYYQDADHANCGSVFIDKESNEPGDVVTVRAIPNDGFRFEYWEDSQLMGNVISTENPYTFTVEGGEKLYAYFTAIDAPSVELPEEGGYAAFCPNAPWVMHDEAMKNGAHILVLEQEDLVKTADGKIYLDSEKEDVLVDLAQQNGLPTIVSGKGTVRFAYKFLYGMQRSKEPLVRWSGDNGVTLTGENFYFYTFNDDLGAFIQYANTDLNLNPNASTRVTIEPQKAYLWMSAYDLADDNGNIPAVIGLSEATYDAAFAGIEGVKIDTFEVNGQKIHTISGVEVQSTGEKGIYIINGKKVLVK